MPVFDHIAIIYNPGSTGDAPKLARELKQKIDRNHKSIGTKASLTPTKHAGHAIELARKVALKYKRPLIVSVSGDGGYNEVINGAMQAKEESKSAQPVTAVVGAGNANDHRRVVRKTPLIDLIKQGNPKAIDLVHISARAKNFELGRYAHSYIGYGVTPQVGHELNKHGKSLLHEIKSILRTYRHYAPFTIEREGKRFTLDNLVFANINEMAKFIKLDEKNTMHDDKFEVIELYHRSKLRMLGTLLRAALIGFKNPPSYSEYELKSLDKLPIQLDGEVEWLPKDCKAVVTSRHSAIDSLF
jgi:diacylglycerol kinase family enzyme